MSYIRIFITIIITCCIKCFVSFRIDIQKLFNKTVDCFLLKELQNPKTEIDYFTSSKNTLPIVVRRLTETYLHGTCCIAPFFDSSFT